MADGRFAPSPTGPLHLGNLRTALCAWLFARSAQSRFLLRIDDLDAVASRAEHEASHRNDLLSLGLAWDEPVVRQSSPDRQRAHRDAIGALEATGRTYRCWCSRREIAEATRAPHGAEVPYPGTCRDRSAAEIAALDASGRRPALRLDARSSRVEFVDRLHGRHVVEVDDFVVRRGDGACAYNVAVVVDDTDAGVGEVVRGDDLLPTTGRQVLVASLLGIDPPAYAHVPLVLGADGERLAKRHGAVTLDGLAALGVRPDEVLGALAASLGLWPPATPCPDPALLIASFDPDALPRTAGRVDLPLVG